jgi:hypothetical protein
MARPILNQQWITENKVILWFTRGLSGKIREQLDVRLTTKEPSRNKNIAFQRGAAYDEVVQILSSTLSANLITAPLATSIKPLAKADDVRQTAKNLIFTQIAALAA